MKLDQVKTYTLVDEEIDDVKVRITSEDMISLQQGYDIILMTRAQYATMVATVRTLEDE